MVISGAGNFGCKCVLPLQLIQPRPRAVSSPYDKIDNLTTWIWLDCVNVMTTRTQLSKMKSCGVVDRVFVSSVPSTIKRIRYTAIWCTTADINYHRLVMTKKWKNAETLGVRNKLTYALWSFGSGKAMTDRRQKQQLRWSKILLAVGNSANLGHTLPRSPKRVIRCRENHHLGICQSNCGWKAGKTQPGEFGEPSMPHCPRRRT